MYYEDLDIYELVKRITEKYDELYEHEDEMMSHDEYMELVEAGEQLLRDEPDFIHDVSQVREDLFTSDRELVALILAIDEMMEED